MSGISLNKSTLSIATDNEYELESLAQETEFNQGFKAEDLESVENESNLCWSNIVSGAISQIVEDTKSITNSDTLLTKAMLYRTTHPELWQKRLAEMENDLQKSLGKITSYPFLLEYHEQFDVFNKAKKELDIKFGNKHPNVDIHFEYNLYNDRTKRKTTYRSLQPNDVTIFRSKDTNLLEKLQSDVDETRGDLPELVVSVKSGNQLFNAVKSLDKTIKRVCIKASMYPDCTQRKTKLKTKYAEVTWKGNCMFAHSFVFKGFTINEIATKFIHLKLVGRSFHAKVTLGSCMIAGEKAHIYIENKIGRQATDVEKRTLTSALKQPSKGFTFNHEFDLKDGI